MLKSKSLTNLIYEINNKPIYYNIKLQKTDEKNFFSSIQTPILTFISENIIEKKINQSNQSNHIANFYIVNCRFIVSLRLFSGVYEGKYIKIHVLQKTSEKKQYVYFMKIY
jgi:hypothetical protein